MSRLVIHRLTLCGFGLYQGRTDIDFPDGFGVFIGPNERGKSTVIAGLTAVVFGLPASTNPDEFGMERYRNRWGPREFWGEVELHAGDARFRLWRNFENHRIRLSRFHDGGWRDEVVGEHNPNARKPNARFIAWLQEMFGHASRELFDTTFCLTQLRTESDSISDELQALLAGGASGGHDKTLEKIVNQAKELTKATGSLGLTARDGRKAGRLDEIEEQLEQLRQRISQSTVSVDEVLRLTEEINERTAALEKLQRESEQSKSTVDALQEWSHLKQRIDDRQAQSVKIKQSVREYESLRLRMERVAHERQEKFPEFESAPAYVGSSWTLWQDLVRLTEDVAQIKAQQKSIDEQLAENQRKQRDTFPWQQDGSAVSWVDRIQNAWRHVRREWDQFAQLRDEWRQLRERRRHEFSPFEEAAPTLLEHVRGYGQKRLSLENQLSQARERLRDAKDQLTRLDDEDTRLGQTLKGLNFGSALAAAVGVIWAIAATILDRLPVGIIPALFFVVVAIAAKANPWAGKIRSRRQSIQKQHEKIKTQDLAHAEAELREINEALQTLEAYVDTPKQYFDDMEEAHVQWMTLTQQGQQLERTMERTVAQWTTEKPGQWTDTEKISVDRLEPGSWVDFAQGIEVIRQLDPLQTLGDVVEEAERIDDAFWQELTERAKAADELRRIRGDLMARREHLVGSRQPGPDGQHQSAGELARHMKDIDAVIHQLSQLDGNNQPKQPGSEDNDGFGEWIPVRQAAFAGRTDTLFDQVPNTYRPIFAAGGHNLNQVVERWRQWSSLVDESRECHGEQEAMLKALGVESPDDLEKSLAAAEGRLRVAISNMEQLLEKHPGLPSWDTKDDVDSVNRRIQEITNEFSQLQERRRQEEDALFQLRGRLSELQGANPLNVAEAELRLQALSEERERLQFELQALAMAHAELADVTSSYYQDHSGRLAKLVGAHFSALTGRDSRQVRFDDDMKIVIHEADGSTFIPSQLSQGARDQLYLALRFGIADVLTKGGHLPFIFDDPFVTYDDERLRLVRESLKAMADQRQIILFSHRGDMGSWGDSVRVSDDGRRSETDSVDGGGGR